MDEDTHMSALLDGPKVMVTRGTLALLSPSGRGLHRGASSRIVGELLVTGRADDNALVRILARLDHRVPCEARCGRG